MQAPEDQVGAWPHGKAATAIIMFRGQHGPSGALHSSARPSSQRWPQTIPGSLDEIVHHHVYLGWSNNVPLESQMQGRASDLAPPWAPAY